MAYTAWAGAVSIAVGDIRRATTPQASGLVFEPRLQVLQVKPNPNGLQI